MPIPRTLPEILGAHADVLKSDIRKCIPATVTAVNAAKMTVDVQVAVNDVLFDPLGNAYSVAAPTIADVPLGVARGGKFFVWVPVSVGDSVLLIFSDLSADSWRLASSAPTQGVDPVFLGRHTLDSAFAIPMFAPDSQALADPALDPTKIIIGRDGGPEIKVSPAGIELGAAGATPPSDYVALASKVETELNAIKANITDILTALAAAVSLPTGGKLTFAPSLPSPYSPGPVASSTVKCA
jgi:hypothetical protein